MIKHLGTQLFPAKSNKCEYTYRQYKPRSFHRNQTCSKSDQKETRDMEYHQILESTKQNTEKSPNDFESKLFLIMINLQLFQLVSTKNSKNQNSLYPIDKLATFQKFLYQEPHITHWEYLSSFPTLYTKNNSR